MNTIVLKDAAGADVPFNYIHTTNNGVQVFERQTGPLLGRSRLSLNLSENAKTNRVKWKLSVPMICSDATDCDTTKISYTQIASGDISLVRSGTKASRDDLAAFQASLTDTAAMKQMIGEGVRL